MESMFPSLRIRRTACAFRRSCCLIQSTALLDAAAIFVPIWEWGTAGAVVPLTHTLVES